MIPHGSDPKSQSGPATGSCEDCTFRTSAPEYCTLDISRPVALDQHFSNCKEFLKTSKSPLTLSQVQALGQGGMLNRAEV